MKSDTANTADTSDADDIRPDRHLRHWRHQTQKQLVKIADFLRILDEFSIRQKQNVVFCRDGWEWHQCLRSWPVKTKDCAALLKEILSSQKESRGCQTLHCHCQFGIFSFSGKKDTPNKNKRVTQNAVHILSVKLCIKDNQVVNSQHEKRAKLVLC